MTAARQMGMQVPGPFTSTCTGEQWSSRLRSFYKLFPQLATLLQSLATLLSWLQMLLAAAIKSISGCKVSAQACNYVHMTTKQSSKHRTRQLRSQAPHKGKSCIYSHQRRPDGCQVGLCHLPAAWYAVYLEVLGLYSLLR